MPESSRSGATAQPAAAGADSSTGDNVPITLAEYKKQQALVRTLINRRQEIDRELVRSHNFVCFWLLKCAGG